MRVSDSKVINYFNVLKIAFFWQIKILYLESMIFSKKKIKKKTYLEQTHNYVMCYEICYKIWYDVKWNTNCKIYNGKKRNMYRISLYYFVHL